MPSYRSDHLQTIDEYDDSEFTIDETDSSVKPLRLLQTQSCKCADCTRSYKRSYVSSFIACVQRLFL